MPAKNRKILVGCDPEIFLRNPKTNKFISAHTLIPGTKNEPFKVPHGAIQVDGVAAEFNIDPALTVQGWIFNNAIVIQEIRNRAKDFELVFEPTAKFEAKYFHNLPDEVRELGCNPDFNAWTCGLNPKPDGDSTTMRTGAGHIHIGWTKNADITEETHVNDCHIVIRHMDYYLGLMSMLWDTDTKRRMLYGKAGAHRRKPYGAEYRTLSNRWLVYQPLQEYVFNTTVQCMNNIFDGVDLEAEFKNAAQIIIDNNIKWWDLKELIKHESMLPKKINLKNLSSFHNKIRLHLPPTIPEEIKKPVKRNPNHMYEEK